VRRGCCERADPTPRTPLRYCAGLTVGRPVVPRSPHSLLCSLGISTLGNIRRKCGQPGLCRCPPASRRPSPMAGPRVRRRHRLDPVGPSCSSRCIAPALAGGAKPAWPASGPRYAPSPPSDLMRIRPPRISSVQSPSTASASGQARRPQRSGPTSVAAHPTGGVPSSPGRSTVRPTVALA
jgi:hypothetical protein